MRKEKIDKLKQEFSLENPYFNIIGLLGTGNHGIAFALPEEKVLKLTSDPQEVFVCNALQGRHCKYLCNIEYMGDFYSVSEERMYTWIIMEQLYKSSEQKWVNDAFNDFRHAWFTLFTDNSISNYLTWSDLWSIYKNKETAKINRCIMLCKDYLSHINDDEDTFIKLSDQQISTRIHYVSVFFEFIEKAYDELFSIFPEGRIDLNEGNFMFDKAGNLKVLDMQTFM